MQWHWQASLIFLAKPKITTVFLVVAEKLAELDRR